MPRTLKRTTHIDPQLQEHLRSLLDKDLVARVPALQWILEPPKRPARRMPPLGKIAAYHNLGSAPHCVRCGDWALVAHWDESSRFLDRAHIIDRHLGGLDDLQNIAPLCPKCHRRQPSFAPGQETSALAWFGLQ